MNAYPRGVIVRWASDAADADSNVDPSLLEGQIQ